MTVLEVLKKHVVPPPECGVECGDGWAKIIDSLISDLIKAGWDRNLSQLKEKFGGLRFYIGAGSPAIHDRISKAENESMLTCEDCGKPGDCKSEHGWLVTRCKECLKKRRQEMKKHQKD